MFNKLLKKITSLGEIKPKFDPTTINDPIALKVEWGPAKRGGSSFKTHSLVAVGPMRMEFQASMGAKIFYLIFLLVGLGVTFGVLYFQLTSGVQIFSIELIGPAILGLVFSVVGGCLLYFGTAPIVFDKRNGMYWKGRKKPGLATTVEVSKKIARLSQIHALQLISEYVRSDKSSYYSYELNLVLDNAERLNVVDHGNQTKVKDDAATLAGFLAVPVWDAL